MYRPLSTPRESHIGTALVCSRCGHRFIRLQLPPFTLIGSTTKPSALSAPLRQRFGLHFHFDFYSVEDLIEITRGMAERLGVAFDPAVNEGIAQRGLGIPRICLRHAERVRDVVQARRLATATVDELELAMALEGTDDLGLCPDHRRLLKALAMAAPRGLSARSLALVLGTEVPTVTDVLEPSLVRLKLMAVGTGGRRITELGLRHVGNTGRKWNDCAGQGFGARGGAD